MRREAQGNRAVPNRDFAGGGDFADFAAADLLDQAGGHTDAPVGGLRVQAAFEAVAGVREDAELAPGDGNPHRIEERHLQENVGGLLGTAADLTAHHAADALGAVVVGDHHHLRVKLVVFAVQREDFLARRGPGAW